MQSPYKYLSWSIFQKYLAFWFRLLTTFVKSSFYMFDSVLNAPLVNIQKEYHPCWWFFYQFNPLRTTRFQEMHLIWILYMFFPLQNNLNQFRSDVNIISGSQDNFWVTGDPMVLKQKKISFFWWFIMRSFAFILNFSKYFHGFNITFDWF